MATRPRIPITVKTRLSLISSRLTIFTNRLISLNRQVLAPHRITRFIPPHMTRRRRILAITPQTLLLRKHTIILNYPRRIQVQIRIITNTHYRRRRTTRHPPTFGTMISRPTQLTQVNRILQFNRFKPNAHKFTQYARRLTSTRVTLHSRLSREFRNEPGPLPIPYTIDGLAASRVIEQSAPRITYASAGIRLLLGRSVCQISASSR